jgi:hypothetical protein
MNDTDLTTLLQDLLLEDSYKDDLIKRVETFQEAGIFTNITNDQGLVVTLANGREFQISIKRSK